MSNTQSSAKRPTVAEVAQSIYDAVVKEVPYELSWPHSAVTTACARYVLRFAARREREVLEAAAELVREKLRRNDDSDYDTGFDHAVVWMSAELRRVAAEVNEDE